MPENLVDKEKVSTFALAFGKDAKRSVGREQGAKVRRDLKKKLTKNFVSSEKGRNFALAFKGKQLKRREH